ncbi:hypothetical protein LOAG_09737 [Loa loa]|uniref:t-SNARE coiled-coil homology domain-containing protein n=1 Tax=Loa loa TaxID=7209 RepID=A0A1I7VJU4_LOALO|nr:hypothetical protein LOAG_09737 [Loa loa]EFO18756.2 hypothetical protein LOAG_09737 [Loa loa]
MSPNSNQQIQKLKDSVNDGCYEAQNEMWEIEKRKTKEQSVRPELKAFETTNNVPEIQVAIAKESAKLLNKTISDQNEKLGSLNMHI